jgi:hypothetical protein
MAENFTPGETVSLSVGITTAAVSFSLAQSANYPDCMVTNAGASTAFVSFGAGAQTFAMLPAAGALTAVPVLAGESMILRKGAGNTACAAITSTGATTLYFTAGQGN